MKRVRIVLVVIIILAGFLFFTTRTQASANVEPGLRDNIVTAGSGSYLVYMKDQANLSAAYSMNWEERGQYVYDTLYATATQSQANLLGYLEAQRSVSAVSEYKSFFIVNAVEIKSDVATFDAIAARPDVAAIRASKVYELPEPVITEGGEVLAIEWGVAKINAPSVWSTFGATGQGVVVANIDTGVRHTHNALVDMYRGTLTGSHDHNFFDPSNVCGGSVCDNNGHGTHTMGTMVGDDGGSNQVGVAPGAIWIAAKGCESNFCSDFALLSSAEWILAPCDFGAMPGDASCDPSMRPDIVNNSWGGGGGDPWYQASVNAWRAAGILPAFSAGNSGPGSSTIGSPGDYCNVVASGATASNDTIGSFSSRGPGDFPACTDKPDVSAPGVAVRSSYSTSDNAYAIANGTSMASPHTAGCMALLLSIDPSLDYDDIYTLLTTTAVDLGAAGFDYNFGYGRIDCFAAAQAIGDPPPITPTPTSDVPTPTTTRVRPTPTVGPTATPRVRPTIPSYP